jgi:hypothetical protein
MRMSNNRQIAKKLEGRPCIYQEKTLIYLARIIEVSADSWGVGFQLEPLKALGEVVVDLERFVLEGSWEVVGLDERSAHAAYVGWFVVYAEDAVENIVSNRAKFDDIRQFIKFIEEQSHEGGSIP